MAAGTTGAARSGAPLLFSGFALQMDQYLAVAERTVRGMSFGLEFFPAFGAYIHVHFKNSSSV